MTIRRTVALPALLGSAALVAVGAASVAARTGAGGKSDHGTAYASINRVANGNEYGSATNTDAVLGSSAITFIATLTPGGSGGVTLNIKKLVLYGKTGSLSGTGSATVTLSGSTEKFSGGKLKLTKGTGSQKGHSFVGTFTGSGDSSTNEFTLHYKGTYK
jgi:hypothetical protein